MGSHCTETVNCYIWEGDSVKKINLALLDIGWTIIQAVERQGFSLEYALLGSIFVPLLSLIPLIFHSCLADASWTTKFALIPVEPKLSVLASTTVTNIAANATLSNSSRLITMASSVGASHSKAEATIGSSLQSLEQPSGELPRAPLLQLAYWLAVVAAQLKRTWLGDDLLHSFIMWLEVSNGDTITDLSEGKKKEASGTLTAIIRSSTGSSEADESQLPSYPGLSQAIWLLPQLGLLVIRASVLSLSRLPIRFANAWILAPDLG
ncbi:unnamed protein product [Protopolystoma xenopodis]|uniref:Uncharacterized protein n=1 Tax=Protopolystoma xenopodis TaxID=117903 RepID=A0A3S5CMY5_9PLAT|nr:unnamed protein product [Protopolystoma xenopodis]